MQTCAPFFVNETGVLSFANQQKRTAITLSFFVGRGDGITRSRLNLYKRFRLFMSAEVVLAVSFSSSGLRSAQTSAPDFVNETGVLSLRPTNKKGTAITLSFLLVEVTGFEPTTSWSRTKRATKLRYTSFSFPNNLPHRVGNCQSLIVICI